MRLLDDTQEKSVRFTTDVAFCIHYPPEQVMTRTKFIYLYFSINWSNETERKYHDVAEEMLRLFCFLYRILHPCFLSQALTQTIILRKIVYV